MVGSASLSASPQRFLQEISPCEVMRGGKGRYLIRPRACIICIECAGPASAVLTGTQVSLAKNDRSECIQGKEGWENRETPAQRETISKQ